MGIHSIFLWCNIHHSPERHSNTHICDVRWETQVLYSLMSLLEAWVKIPSVKQPWRKSPIKNLLANSVHTLWHDGNNYLRSLDVDPWTTQQQIWQTSMTHSSIFHSSILAHGRPRKQQHSASEVFASQDPPAKVGDLEQFKLAILTYVCMYVCR